MSLARLNVDLQGMSTSTCAENDDFLFPLFLKDISHRARSCSRSLVYQGLGRS